MGDDGNAWPEALERTPKVTRLRLAIHPVDFRTSLPIPPKQQLTRTVKEIKDLYGTRDRYIYIPPTCSTPFATVPSMISRAGIPQSQGER
jgi:hypothetical protein